MVILDTNVISEILRPAPSKAVMDWLDSQPRSQVFTTTITRAELLYGVKIMPKGSRREKLWRAALAIFDEDLEDKILSFDPPAADRYAEVGSRRKALGRPISQLDAMIASITRVHDASLATRNTQDFFECEIDVINPWDD